MFCVGVSVVCCWMLTSEWPSLYSVSLVLLQQDWFFASVLRKTNLFVMRDVKLSESTTWFQSNRKLQVMPYVQQLYIVLCQCFMGLMFELLRKMLYSKKSGNILSVLYYRIITAKGVLLSLLLLLIKCNIITVMCVNKIYKILLTKILGQARLNITKLPWRRDLPIFLLPASVSQSVSWDLEPSWAQLAVEGEGGQPSDGRGETQGVHPLRTLHGLGLWSWW